MAMIYGTGKPLNDKGRVVVPNILISGTEGFVFAKKDGFREASLLSWKMLQKRLIKVS
jgi:hypothetical protein